MDTNVLIYDTVEDSLHHEKAKELMNSGIRWAIPSIVCSEYLWVLKNKDINKKTAINLLKDNYLEDKRTKYLPINKSTTMKTLKTLKHDNLPLDHYDDTSILKCIDLINGNKIATFDKRLRKYAKKKQIKVLPDNYPEQN